MKSWISKALLGLCIAAPAMAKLPVKTDRYTGLIVRTPGFTTTQNRLIRTGLGLWLQGLQREMPAGSSNFKQVGTTYDEDFAGIVSIQLVSGVSPVTCAPWDALDQCAVVITGDDGIQQNVVAKVYTHFVRSGTLATPVSEPIKLQNIAIRTFGRILGVPFSSNPGAMGYSIAWEAKWANELVFPSLAESNAAAAIYGLGARLPDIIPVIEYETKKSNGAKIYGFGNALNYSSMPSNYTLRTARWVVNTSANGEVIENILQANGRIRQFHTNECYPEELWGGITIYGLAGDADLGLSLPIAKGAPRTEMVRSSGSIGDVISWPHPGTCLTGMGAAVDLLNSL